MKTILLVDDEPKIRELARDYLEHAGLRRRDGRRRTSGAGRGADARAGPPGASTSACPRSTGSRSSAALRRDSTVPIVVLTARDDEIDKLLGLELGADDYVTKPFSPRELVARVKAVLRRSEQAARARGAHPRRRRDDRRAAHAGDGGGSPVELTPTEFQLLATLAARPGRIFTRAQLLDALRGVAFESYERAIDTHVKNLRRKLEPDPRAPRYVLTVYGVGYRFADDRAT